MRKSIFFMVGAIVSCMLIAGAALAEVSESIDAESVGNNGMLGFSRGKFDRLSISHPEKNGVVSGYFIPVSWSDPAVENGELPYPENYKASQKSYRVMIYDRSEVVLEKVVTGLNYYVFTIDEIKDVLRRKAYRFQVENAETLSTSHPLGFFYDMPELDDSVMEELQKAPATPGEGVPADGNEDGQFTSLENAYAATDTSSYTYCPTCYSQYWPGMVVFYVRYPTTYSKVLRIYCGSNKYYEKTVASSFTGPVFASMTSGYNYNAVYWDGATLSNRCIDIYPFEYTWVIFP